ncbi:MAG: DUF2304 domain-containing protein [Bacilli bacterium]|nr:DUF2304 domain-containing protein [Bacilli bacterium]
MSKSLIITLVVVSICLIIITSHYLKKDRIPIKYSLLWYLFSLLILVVALFPGLFTIISKTLGFEAMSNMVIGIIIGLLLLLTMALTIMIAGQKKKTILLIQELSLLKSEVKEKNK